MKKLITVKDVEILNKKGKNFVYVDGNTIITPAAKDTAAECEIIFTYNKENTSCCEKKEDNNYNETQSKYEESNLPDIESKIISKVSSNLGEVDISFIAQIVKKVLLETMFNQAVKSFDKECDPSGLILVRGDTVKCERFDHKNPGCNVHLKNIVETNESPNMGAGFMTFEKTSFNWELCYEEFEYIIEGNLSITINGKTYNGKAGDVFFIPKNSKITWNSQGYAKIFYVTYPANWAEITAEK